MNVINNKIIPFILIAIITVATFLIPYANAVSINYLPVVTADYYSQLVYAECIPLLYDNDNQREVRFGSIGPSDIAVYAIPRSSKSTLQQYYFYFISKTSSPSFIFIHTSGNMYGVTGSTPSFTPTIITVDNYTLYTYGYNFPGNVSSNSTIIDDSGYVKIVNSVSEAQQDYLYGSPPIPKSLNYTLPAGNAIFIEYYGNCNYTIKTASDSPGGMNPSNVNGIKSGYSSEINSFNYNSSFLDYTSFSGYGNSTVLGQYVTYTYNGNTAIEAPSGAKYLVIINPMLNNMNDTGKTNPHITITASSILKFYIIPMNTQLNNGEWTSSGNENDIIIGEYDEDTQEWYTTDNNGDPTNPVNGGLTISGEPKTITEWLETIVNTLTDFFKGPVNAINILIQNLSGFVNSLKSLYMWLPTPVYSLLTSAVMVAITIGVIKIFI